MHQALAHACVPLQRLHLQFHSAGFMCPFYVHAMAPALEAFKFAFKFLKFAAMQALVLGLLILQADCMLCNS